VPSVAETHSAVLAVFAGGLFPVGGTGPGFVGQQFDFRVDSGRFSAALELLVAVGVEAESLVRPVEDTVVRARSEELDDTLAHVTPVERLARTHALADRVCLDDVGNHLDDELAAVHPRGEAVLVDRRRDVHTGGFRRTEQGVSLSRVSVLDADSDVGRGKMGPGGC